MINEECIKEWGSMLIGEPVHQLAMIQNIDFAYRLFHCIDEEYFSREAVHSFLKLFDHISNYYANQIGINVRHLVTQLNVYTDVMEVWELALGLAIKGNKREHHINIILQMDSHLQQQLMKVVSNIINKMGEASQESEPELSRKSIIYQNDQNLLLDLYEQNQELKERIQQLTQQNVSLKNSTTFREKDLENQLEGCKKQKYAIFDILNDSKCGVSFSTGISPVDAVRELVQHIKYQTGELERRDERIISCEEINRNIKMAYRSLEQEKVEKERERRNAISDEMEKKMDQLREEIRYQEKRENQLLKKIEELEENKYYMKSIIARLQKRKEPNTSTLTEKLSSIQNESEVKNNENQLTPLKSYIENNHQNIQEQVNEINRQKKQEKEIKELKQMIKEQVEKNKSLRKINAVLEKTIEDFVEEIKQIGKRYEKEYRQMMKDVNGLMDDGRQWEELEQMLEHYQKKIEEMTEQERQYQMLIHSKQNQGESCEQKSEQQEKIIISDDLYEEVNFEEEEENEGKDESDEEQNKEQEKPQQNFRETQSSSKQFSQSIAEYKHEWKVPLVPQERIMESKQSQLSESSHNQTINIVLSPPPTTNDQLVVPETIFTGKSKIYVDDDEEQQQGIRRRQYSYMGNKASILQSDFMLNIKEKQNEKSVIVDEQDESEGVLDITKIEEELGQIKEKYLQANEKYGKIVEKARMLKKKMIIESEEKQEPQEKINLQAIQNQQLRKKLYLVEQKQKQVQKKLQWYATNKQSIQNIDKLTGEIHALMLENDGLANNLLMKQMSSQSEPQIMEVKLQLEKAEHENAHLRMQIKVLLSAMAHSIRLG